MSQDISLYFYCLEPIESSNVALDRAGKVILLCKATVTVHDEGNMPWYRAHPAHSDDEPLHLSVNPSQWACQYH